MLQLKAAIPILLRYYIDTTKSVVSAHVCIQYIVSKLGIDIMLDPTPDGGTPLHFASSAGKLKTVRWLVNHDVSGLLISAQDDNGDTPAHDAAGAG